MKLHLGVMDVAYNEPPAPAPRKGGKARGASGTQTTGDVATWLENKYGVMAFFVQKHEEDIANALANSIAGAFENMLMGNTSSDPYGSGTSAIEEMFRSFLDMREMNGQPGVPTHAALRGVSHRFARRQGPARSSFIDTGLYQSSFKAWIEE